MKITDILNKIGNNSKSSQKEIASTSHKKRQSVLKICANNIKGNMKNIIDANKQDVDDAKKSNLKTSYVDRLRLDSERILGIVKSLDEISELPDPLNRKLAEWERPNGLKISRKPTPLGVLGIIFESRPNVTVDAAGLSIKSGNSVILRCGSDSYNSCKILTEIIRNSLKDCQLSPNIVQLVPSKNREAVDHMLKMSGIIDVIIPRGGKSLVEKVQKHSTVPVFSHLEGICHVYVDKYADFEKSYSVVVNGKMRRTGICGATETLLVNSQIANEFLPSMYDKLNSQGCEVVGDKFVQSIIPDINLATD